MRLVAGLQVVAGFFNFVDRRGVDSGLDHVLQTYIW
jgi:hypothetical protein